MAIDLSTQVSLMIVIWPKKEMFVLSSPIQRAADSVALNVSEGSTGLSDKEFKRFLTFANRSGLEVITALYLAKNRNLINKKIFENIYGQYETLIVKIQALIKTLKD